MNAAKNAVKDFMHKDGKHTTNVHESMSPAVTDTTHIKQHHNEATTAVDKEVHQDHYHTTVQPVKGPDETLDTQHHHKMGAVETRKFEHGNDAEVQRRLQEEHSKHRDTTVEGETHHTSSAAPTVAGEHKHHHVHETVIPHLQRTVIEPHVTHTTVPVHEVHHNKAVHHGASELPAISLDEFKKQGGVLQGREERSDFFEGEPRNMQGHHANHRPEDATNEFRRTGHVDTHGHGNGLTGNSHHHTTGQTGTGLTGHNTTSTTGVAGEHRTGSTGLTGSDTTRSGGITGDHAGHTRNDSAGLAQDNTTHTKPSLLSRLNPMKDADGDGKKGIMD